MQDSQITEPPFTTSQTSGNAPFNVTITPAKYVQTWKLYEITNDEAKLIKSFDTNVQHIQTYDKPTNQKLLITFKNIDDNGISSEGGKLLSVNVN
jgi:hypothetical protein